ncbi:MAG: hypothetical protein O3B73_02620 [bacterium]|nr:hypothetical protein [bacterium]
MARDHLGDVLRKAFLDAPDVDDSGEVFPYRVSTMGLLASAVFILGWCVASGMSFFVAVVFFGLYCLAGHDTGMC